MVVQPLAAWSLPAFCQALTASTWLLKLLINNCEAALRIELVEVINAQSFGLGVRSSMCGGDRQ